MTGVAAEAVARLLFAPILVMAVAVLVKGYADVGDGFSGGAIASLGILLQYVAFGRERAERALPVRHAPKLAYAGLLGAVAVAAAPLLAGEPLLTHFPQAGAHVIHLGTLELITAVAFDLAIFVLVVGATVGIVHAIAAEAGEADRWR